MKTPSQLPLFDEEWVTVQWLAERLGRSESSVKRLLDSGEIYAYRYNERGKLYIVKRSVLEYEERLRRQYVPDLNSGLKNGHIRPDTNGMKGQK